MIKLQSDVSYVMLYHHDYCHLSSDVLLHHHDVIKYCHPLSYIGAQDDLEKVTNIAYRQVN